MSEDNEYSEHYEPQPPGMSTGSKMLLMVLGFFGVVCVACCGGVIWFVQKNFDIQMSDDPVVVRQTQREILDLEVPARFDPLQSVKTKLMFANMDMAFFQAAGAENAQFVLMKMTLTTEEIHQQQIEHEFDQRNPSADQLEDATTETRSYTVDGKEIQVSFSHGKLREGEDAPDEHVGEDWFTVSSMMSAPGGMIMFSVTGPEEEFDEEEIETMIRSFRFPDGE